MAAALNPAPFPTAQNHPSYSGNFIPIIWETVFQVKFYLTTVFSEIANTDYEGAIRNFGDTVRIPIRPTILINKFVEGQDLDVQVPGADSIDFPIQRGLYFNTLATDVTKHQSNIDYVSAWADDASKQTAITIDREVLNLIPADAHPLNSGATAGAISGNVNLGATGAALTVGPAVVMDAVYRGVRCLYENDVPPEPDKISVVSPVWFVHHLKRSELRQANLMGDPTSVTRTGQVGKIDTVGKFFMSNNLLPITDGANTTYNVLLAHTVATTFASQMTKMETFRSATTFGDIMRGLDIYDFKVIKDQGLCNLYVRDVPAATALE